MGSSNVEFHKKYTYLQYRKVYLTYQMYALLERIIVETHVDRPLSVVQCTKMCCAIKIMQNLQQPVFHTKFNQNTVMVINMCLLKTFNWNTLVPNTNKHPNHMCTVAHIMLCLTRFYITKTNKMQLRQLYIANGSLSCCGKNCFQSQS